MNKACQMVCLELLTATSSPGELVLGLPPGVKMKEILLGVIYRVGTGMGCSWYVWSDACCVDVVCGACMMVYVMCYICVMYIWCV